MRPKIFVNRRNFALFASHLAHEYKRMGYENFIRKYKNMKYRGMYKNYLDAYIEYLENKANERIVDYYEKN